MAVFTTYEAIGNREDLMDVITTVSPDQTPMFNDFRKVNVSATYVEWQTDALAAAGANAAVEGADYSFGTLTPTARVGNYTQIFNKTFQVSETEQAVSKAGRDSEYAYQVEKAMKELKNDIEYNLIRGTVASGTSAAARTLKGVLSWISTNVETGSGTGTEALTETMFNDALQGIYDGGGRPDTAYVAGWQKRKISGFSTSNQRQINAGDGKISNFVDVYMSDFGVINIKYDVHMPSDKVAILEKDKWQVGILRPIAKKDVPSIGDSVRGVVEGELTLIALNEKSSGQITQLTTS